VYVLLDYVRVCFVGLCACMFCWTMCVFVLLDYVRVCVVSVCTHC